MIERVWIETLKGDDSALHVLHLIRKCELCGGTGWLEPWQKAYTDHAPGCPDCGQDGHTYISADQATPEELKEAAAMLSDDIGQALRDLTEAKFGYQKVVDAAIAKGVAWQ